MCLEHLESSLGSKIPAFDQEVSLKPQDSLIDSRQSEVLSGIRKILKSASDYENSANPSERTYGYIQEHVKILPDGNIEFFVSGVPVVNSRFAAEHEIKRGLIDDPEHPGKLIYDRMQEFPPTIVTLHGIKRTLIQSGIIPKYVIDSAEVKFSIKEESDNQTGEISFIVKPEVINLRELYKNLLTDLNPQHLRRDILLNLIDKERLAAFWKYDEFIFRHHDKIIEGNADILSAQAARREIIIVNEKSLIEMYGNDKLKKLGMIPDNLENKDHYYLNFKFSDHRFVCNGVPYLIIPNDGINPGFPSKTTGNVQRKDENHPVKRIFLEHAQKAGIVHKGEGSDIFTNINNIPSAEPGALIVLPDKQVALLIALQYQSKIDSLLEGSTSSMHFDFDTGRGITSSLVAAIDPEILAEKIDDETLRAVLAEQQAEDWFHDLDRSGRKYKNLIRTEMGFPTEYSVLALRRQFQGLSQRFFDGVSGIGSHNFLTAPVFQEILNRNK